MTRPKSIILEGLPAGERTAKSNGPSNRAVALTAELADLDARIKKTREDHAVALDKLLIERRDLQWKIKELE